MPATRELKPFSGTTEAWRGTGPRPTFASSTLSSSPDPSRDPTSPVARGPVPRDPSTKRKMPATRRTQAIFWDDRGMARDRPSPYVRGHHWNGEGQALALRCTRRNLGRRRTDLRTTVQEGQSRKEKNRPSHYVSWGARFETAPTEAEGRSCITGMT